MSVNFTGIKDCKVMKKEYSRDGIYLDENMDFRRGQKDYREILITARLTNDEDGYHLSEYRNALPKEYENSKGKDLVSIHLKEFKPRPSEDDVYLPNLSYSTEASSMQMLNLNGHDIVSLDDEKLPIMSFLAHMTKRDVDLAGLNNNQKKYAKVVNNAINDMALDYLDI